jgi:glycosyltransferase involved in cell wall biosynthesis
MNSIILTVHNKDWLIGKVISAIYKHTLDPFELIVVLDGCTDNSKDEVLKYIDSDNSYVFETPDVFETKANNVGLNFAEGDYSIIIQDDMIINETGWDQRLKKPFVFDDVFAVTARTAHNWEFNPNTKDLYSEEDADDHWSDILFHTDHAHRHTISRDVFAIRSSVNRGPLMLDNSVLEKLNYLDESYSPQDMDDHDLCYRAYSELNKVCGCYWIDFISDDSWGGTRINGSPAPWLLKANQKNTKIFYSRHKELINQSNHNEDRILKNVC